MSPHERIEAIHTIAETMVRIGAVDIPYIELPAVERPEELSPENIVNGEESETQEIIDEYLDDLDFEIGDETVDDVDIAGVGEWWEAWCEVRDILDDAFVGAVENGDSATLTENEPNDSMSVRNELINFHVTVYAGGDVAFISEYAIDTEANSWGMLYEGFHDTDDFHQITLGREVARAELAIIINTTTSAAETLDYWQTELDHFGWNQKGWADIRGVSRQTVNDRVRGAAKSLEE